MPPRQDKCECGNTKLERAATCRRCYLEEDRQRTCEVEGCERAHYARGLCNMHFKRFKRTGSTDKRVRTRTVRQPNVPCPTPGCNNLKRVESATCRVCYSRTRPKTPPCTVEGCDNIGRGGNGLCVGHAWRLKHHGDVLASIALGAKAPKAPKGIKRNRPRKAPQRDECGCGKSKLVTSAVCLDCYRANRCPKPMLRRVLIPRDKPINSWADAPAMEPETPLSVLYWAKAQGRATDATRYVADTGLTRETIRNAVYCPVCGAGPTYRCLYSSEFGPFSREKAKFHPERVQAAVEKLGPMRDTGTVRVKTLVQ